MQNRRLDVLEILEKEKEYHLDQVKRINLALSALKGELSQDVVEKKKTPGKKGRVQWRTEIDKLYEGNNVLTVDEIQLQLFEKGIVEAQGAKGKSAISTTLRRKVGKDGFKKISTGTYGFRDEQNQEKKSDQPTAKIKFIDKSEFEQI